MSTDVEPLVFLAGNDAYCSETPNWELHLPGEGDEARRFRTTLRFERFFRSLPVVHLGLTSFDISNQDAARLRVRAEKITLDGFDIVIETWRASQIWSVEVSWLAIGS